MAPCSSVKSAPGGSTAPIGGSNATWLTMELAEFVLGAQVSWAKTGALSSAEAAMNVRCTATRLCDPCTRRPGRKVAQRFGQGLALRCGHPAAERFSHAVAQRFSHAVAQRFSHVLAP